MNYVVKSIYNKGKTLYENGDYEKALEFFDELLRHKLSGLASDDRVTYEVLFMRGLSLQILGYDFGAIKDMSLAIKLYPNNPSLYFIRSTSYSKICEFQKSIDDLKLAIHYMEMDCSLTRDIQVKNPYFKILLEQSLESAQWDLENISNNVESKSAILSKVKRREEHYLDYKANDLILNIKSNSHSHMTPKKANIKSPNYVNMRPTTMRGKIGQVKTYPTSDIVLIDKFKFNFFKYFTGDIPPNALCG